MYSLEICQCIFTYTVYTTLFSSTAAIPKHHHLHYGNYVFLKEEGNECCGIERSLLCLMTPLRAGEYEIHRLGDQQP